MDKIVIFGAGKEAKSSFNFLKYLGLEDHIYGFCDNKITDDTEESSFLEKPLRSYKFYAKSKHIFVVGVKKKEFKEQIKKQLEDNGETYYTDIRSWLIDAGMDPIKCDRYYCAFFHQDSMEEYYETVESDDMMNVFWHTNSVFSQYFERLDLESVIELACGRGRHVRKYVELAGHITLVDILGKNINFCKDRYNTVDKISYYKNNGFNLEELESNSYTSLFCYDAMVHFEMFDIYEYLKDFHRVLRAGGLALLHHSNNTDYKATFGTANDKHGRAFMSKELFAYLAYKAGFEIVEQKIIDWGNVSNLDCVSLIRK